MFSIVNPVSILEDRMRTGAVQITNITPQYGSKANIRSQNCFHPCLSDYTVCIPTVLED